MRLLAILAATSLAFSPLAVLAGEIQLNTEQAVKAGGVSQTPIAVAGNIPIGTIIVVAGVTVVVVGVGLAVALGDDDDTPATTTTTTTTN